MSSGAFSTGVYPNYLGKIGIAQEEASDRIDACFHTLFFSETEKIYETVGLDCGCMVDTGNDDARSEGMSYGMMMCVQMDRKDIFDRLWRFSKRFMCQKAGKYKGYFAWSVRLDGKHNAEGPAPDGEEYFAMALLMASARWESGNGTFNYEAEARAILRHCLHQPELAEGGQPMWDPETRYIKFVPDADFSDPSYHLPHFYELFALKADEADRSFWKAAARASREYIIKSAHSVTGMCPEYADYEGYPRHLFRKQFEYYSDAYRVAMNIALDHIWFGGTQRLSGIVTRLQDWFSNNTQLGSYHAYGIDGTEFDEPAMHPTAIIAVNAAASIASRSPYSPQWLRDFWGTPLRTGKRRYYDNCLYFFCLLMLSGRYRIYL